MTTWFSILGAGEEERRRAHRTWPLVRDRVLQQTSAQRSCRILGTMSGVIATLLELDWTMPGSTGWRDDAGQRWDMPDEALASVDILDLASSRQP